MNPHAIEPCTLRKLIFILNIPWRLNMKFGFNYSLVFFEEEKFENFESE